MSSNIHDHEAAESGMAKDPSQVTAYLPCSASVYKSRVHDMYRPMSQRGQYGTIFDRKRDAVSL